MIKNLSELSFIILTLSQLKGIGATFIKKHIGTIKHESHCWGQSTTEKSITKFLDLTNKKYSQLEIQDAIAQAEDILNECESNQISLISIAEDNYPENLLEIKDPPPVLFFIGDSSLLKLNSIAIIGTRKPNDNGKIIAERIGKYFAAKGWTICNGLADGIDTFSVLGQDNSCFAKVVGIVGSGLARSAFRSLPKQSIANIDHVLQNGGLILSEMPPFKKQDTFSVVKSCRIQAGIGIGLILVQSSLNGGSKFTVKAAVDLCRTLGIVYPIKSDINRDDYSANRKIIESGVRGLSEFVELKNDKNSNSKIVILSSKASYPEFESALDEKNQVLALSF